VIIFALGSKNFSFIYLKKPEAHAVRNSKKNEKYTEKNKRLSSDRAFETAFELIVIELGKIGGIKEYFVGIEIRIKIFRAKFE